MNRILRKDPIVEAVCEFHFDSSDWDWTVPGLLWGQIRDDFPLKQQFDLVPQGSNETIGVSQLNFWRQDKSAVVRIQENELAIVQRAPYTGWPHFRGVINEILEKYRKVIPNSVLQDTSLRYLNRLPLPPENEFNVGHYLNVLPTMPNIGSGTLGAWMQQAQAINPEQRLVLHFRAGMFPTPEQDDLMMVIDITASDLSKEALDDEEMAWLEVAHQQIEDLFFACLKQPYLELLQLEENTDED